MAAQLANETARFSDKNRLYAAKTLFRGPLEPPAARLSDCAAGWVFPCPSSLPALLNLGLDTPSWLLGWLTVPKLRPASPRLTVT